MRITVETVTLEDGHHPTVLHLTILYNGLEDDLPVTIHILKRIPGNLFQEFSRREHGTGIKPTGYVVALDMIKERLSGYRENDVLQFLQIAHSCYFFQCIRITENEIAETEVVGNDVTQIHIHLLGILIHEAGSIAIHIILVLHFCRLKNQGHKQVVLTDFSHQLDTCHGVNDSFPRITGISDNPQHILLIPII